MSIGPETGIRLMAKPAEASGPSSSSPLNHRAVITLSDLRDDQSAEGAFRTF
jgi:hypothetical protein